MESRTIITQGDSIMRVICLIEIMENLGFIIHVLTKQISSIQITRDLHTLNQIPSELVVKTSNTAHCSFSLNTSLVASMASRLMIRYCSVLCENFQPSHRSSKLHLQICTVCNLILCPLTLCLYRSLYSLSLSLAFNWGSMTVKHIQKKVILKETDIKHKQTFQYAKYSLLKTLHSPPKKKQCMCVTRLK